MSAGMMPAFARPGLIRPGELGPMIRVPAACACAKNAAVSCTGTPSVITTTSGTEASIASSTAPLVNFGGTKITDTSAPPSLTASATEPNTGNEAPSNSTFWPALPGVTPPTTVAPEVSMRWVCLRPSDPVMPCTTIREFSVRKMATSRPSVFGGELGDAGGGAVHRVHHLDHGQVRLVQDPATLVGVVAIQPNHQRLGDRLALALQ